MEPPRASASDSAPGGANYHWLFVTVKPTILPPRHAGERLPKAGTMASTVSSARDG